MRAALKLSGQCLCGAVAFDARADDAGVHACHCSQCRRWSGNYWTSINVAYDTLKFTKGDASLKWFRSSDWARRGFCAECGSALFWHGDKLEDHRRRIAIAAGSLAAPTGLHLSEHIFVGDKGDFYEIADDAPQKEKY